MSLFGGISDFLTGGRDEQAEQALAQAQQAYSAVKSPTQQELSLPELQMYVQAGIITPAQAQAFLQQSNAYETENVPQAGTAAMQQALGELSSISDAGPMGTPVEQAQSAQNVQGLNNAVQGQRGAIEQQMEAKGTPSAMVQAALQNQYVGQDAQQAYHNSLDQQAAAYQAAVAALAEKGTLGGNLQGQQNTQANTVAQAQNAMQQFNAANQQNASENNANRAQQANQANAQNAQNVSNQNVGTKNARTAYNTQQAQTAFQDAMSKAAGQAGISSKQAQNYQTMGNQSYDTAMKTIGGLSDLGASAVMPSTGAGAAGLLPMGLVAHGGILGDHDGCYHDGGICMDGGGIIPGPEIVPGNSLKNDVVPINVGGKNLMGSGGEAVIPKTSVENNMPQVLDLIAQGRGQEPHEMNPSDIATVLKALRELRMGVAA